MVSRTKKKHISNMPKGWYMSGGAPKDYDCRLDTSEFHSGTRSVFVKNKVEKPADFGTLMQNFEADEYLGKRLEITFWVKTKNVKGMVAPWMRVDDKSGETIAFDNMCERFIKGTTDWNQYSIVLDVPPDSSGIYFGIIISGKAQLWLDDIEVKEVSKKVAVTNCRCYSYKTPKGPQNLNFEEN